MKITKQCILDGNTYTMDIPKLTPKLLAEGMAKRDAGAMIQNAFPYLSADEREFLLTGTPGDVWDKMFGGGDD
jgi:hypothetical protein